MDTIACPRPRYNCVSLKHEVLSPGGHKRKITLFPLAHRYYCKNINYNI